MSDDGARPPDELRGSLFAIVPEWILQEDGDVVKLYAILDRYAGKDRRVWPGQTELAEKMRCSDRQVRRHLTRLREMGALSIVKRRYNGTTVYVLQKDPPDYNAWPERPDSPVLTDRTGESALSGHASPPNESQSTRAIEPEPPLSRGFDQFWTMYPRKEAKGTARRSWTTAAKKARAEDIIDGAIRYRDDPNRDDSFTAHASTWLNGERWNDGPLPPRNRGKSSTSHLPPSDRVMADDPNYWEES